MYTPLSLILNSLDFFNWWYIDTFFAMCTKKETRPPEVVKLPRHSNVGRPGNVLINRPYWILMRRYFFNLEFVLSDAQFCIYYSIFFYWLPFHLNSTIFIILLLYFGLSTTRVVVVFRINNASTVFKENLMLYIVKDTNSPWQIGYKYPNKT